MQRVAGVALGVLVLTGLAGCAGDAGRAAERVTPPTRVEIAPSTTVTSTAPAPRQNAIEAENARQGTGAWHVTKTSFPLQGYADRVSVEVGDSFTLYVASIAPTFRVEAYRMGWYGGRGGRLVWRSDELPVSLQPEADRDHDTNMVTAPWQPTLSKQVPADWPPGAYLLKLVSTVGESYVPLTVRDDTSDAAVIAVSAVTTWQAYNDWGGYSLYHGPGLSPTKRADIVSYDRPYAGNGSGDFLSGEHGLVALAEHLGLDITYTTDIDLHEHPELLTNHKVMVSLGHDEYWTRAMREGVEAARDHGMNIMFLGANALFRRIRLEPSPLGVDRHEVNYRDIGNDPDYGTNTLEPTTSWREAPHARPESTLTGVFYECNPVNVDGVVADASSWVFDGTGLRDGDHLSLLVGTEYDRVNPGAPTPPEIEVLLHSPLRCRGRASFSDAAYYTTFSGAGVFDSGTGAWVCKLYTGCPADVPPRADPLIQRITENLLRVFAAGPAGLTHPSHGNLEALDITR